MAISSTQNGSEIIIKVDGKFDFSCHREFRDTYVHTNGASSNYVVDLSNADYLDSSALGMLLLLREHAGSENAKIILKGASHDVKDILLVSNFDKLFKLS